MSAPPEDGVGPPRRDTTLRKGLRLLEILAAKGDLSLGELSQASDLSKANAHRLLQTLADEGYVAQEARTARYCATLKLWEIGVARSERPDLVGPCLPAMQELGQATRETVILGLLDGTEVLYLHRIDSPEAVRSFTRVGERAPAHCVATGKAMLAFDPRGAEYWRGLPLQRHSDATIVEVDAFIAEMQATRERGYSINLGEWRGAVRGLAAPIAGWDGRARMAIGIAGPGERFPADRIETLAPLVRAAAGTLSASLGAKQRDGKDTGRGRS